MYFVKARARARPIGPLLRACCMVSLLVEAGIGEGQRRDINTGWKLPYPSLECLQKSSRLALQTESAVERQFTQLVKTTRRLSEKSKTFEETNEKNVSRAVQYFYVPTAIGPVDPELDSTATWKPTSRRTKTNVIIDYDILPREKRDMLACMNWTLISLW